MFLLPTFPPRCSAVRVFLRVTRLSISRHICCKSSSRSTMRVSLSSSAFFENLFSTSSNCAFLQEFDEDNDDDGDDDDDENESCKTLDDLEKHRRWIGAQPLVARLRFMPAKDEMNDALLLLILQLAREVSKEDILWKKINSWSGAVLWFRCSFLADDTNVLRLPRGCRSA